MTVQQAFFTSDTALLRDRRGATDGNTPALETTPNMQKTLTERLIAAWLAPWSHGFTPLW